MRPPSKLQVFAKFWPQKVTILYHPRTFQIYLRQTFSVSQLKINVKGLQFVDVAEIQEAVIDELKKVQKEEISIAFQKMYDGAKACN